MASAYVLKMEKRKRQSPNLEAPLPTVYQILFCWSDYANQQFTNKSNKFKKNIKN